MNAKAVSRSASLPDFVDEEVRSIASRENRSIGNVLESAVRVFTLLPKDTRDLLVEIACDEKRGAATMSEVARQMMYSHARGRFLTSAANVGRSLQGTEVRDPLDDAVVISSRL
jgi:hypothetical protein